MRALSLLVGAFWILGCAAAVAQDIPALQVLADEPGADGVKCGVAAETMVAPAVQTLKASGLDLEREFSSPYLYLQADFRFRDEPRLCSWRIGLSVRALPVTDRRDRFPDSGFERVVLCEAELSGSTAGDAARPVAGDIRDYLKACLAAVTYRDRMHAASDDPAVSAAPPEIVATHQ